jgi:hypothetical protein
VLAVDPPQDVAVDLHAAELEILVPVPRCVMVTRAQPCARVTMTQRGTGTRISSSAAPSRTVRPTRSSSPAPSTTTLARNRRRSRPSSVPVDTTVTAALPESWNAPVDPSNGAHDSSASVSVSDGFS